MERAQAVLDELRTIVPYEHAEIAFDDPFSGKRRLLVNAGYADDLLEHFHGPEFAASLTELGMFETGEPRRMRDVPGDKLAVRTIAEFLLPAGYREGLTMCLRTSDGRVTGCSTSRPATKRTRPTTRARRSARSARPSPTSPTPRSRLASCCSSWSRAPPRSPSGPTATRSRCPASPATGC